VIQGKSQSDLTEPTALAAQRSMGGFWSLSAWVRVMQTKNLVHSEMGSKKQDRASQKDKKVISQN